MRVERRTGYSVPCGLLDECDFTRKAPAPYSDLKLTVGHIGAEVVMICIDERSAHAGVVDLMEEVRKTITEIQEYVLRLGLVPRGYRSDTRVPVENRISKTLTVFELSGNLLGPLHV